MSGIVPTARMAMSEQTEVLTSKYEKTLTKRNLARRMSHYYQEKKDYMSTIKGLLMKIYFIMMVMYTIFFFMTGKYSNLTESVLLLGLFIYPTLAYYLVRFVY